MAIPGIRRETAREAIRAFAKPAGMPRNAPNSTQYKVKAMNAWGYEKSAAGIPRSLCILLLAGFTSVVGAAEGGYTYRSGDQGFPYTVTSTGENYSFEFTRNPGSQEERLKAALHVLQTVYDDESIPSRHSHFFTKEGAKCFVFEATFYSYNSCFLPNDYSPGNENRFWGFVTQVPNGLWLVTRNLLPALLVLGGFLFLMLRKSRPASRDHEGQAIG